MKAQYGILRFKKYKGPAISPIEAHNERTKEQYASNPDIDTDRSGQAARCLQNPAPCGHRADRCCWWLQGYSGGRSVAVLR